MTGENMCSVFHETVDLGWIVAWPCMHHVQLIGYIRVEDGARGTIVLDSKLINA